MAAVVTRSRPASASKISPLLGVWAMLIAAVLTFAWARINLIVIDALVDGVRFAIPHTPDPTPARAGVVLDA
jgi:hypothetical protein